MEDKRKPFDREEFKKVKANLEAALSENEKVVFNGSEIKNGYPKTWLGSMFYNCSYCKDEGWIHTNGGLTDSPCPMNCREKKNPN